MDRILILIECPRRGFVQAFDMALAQLPIGTYRRRIRSFSVVGFVQSSPQNKVTNAYVSLSATCLLVGRRYYPALEHSVNAISLPISWDPHASFTKAADGHGPGLFGLSNATEWMGRLRLALNKAVAQWFISVCFSPTVSRYCAYPPELAALANMPIMEPSCHFNTRPLIVPSC